MPFKPGQSGNPAGRPPKNRALTELLEKAGNRTLENADGKRQARKRLLAESIWQLATAGQVELPGGRVLAVESLAEWVGVWKWIYTHIDGPPKGEIDLTSGGQVLDVKAYIGISPDDWDEDGEAE